MISGDGQQQGNGGGGKLLQHGHRERRSPAADLEPGLDLMFEQLDIVLKFARKKLAGFAVEPRDVGNQRQHPKQQNEPADEHGAHRSLLRRRSWSLARELPEFGALDQSLGKSESAAQAKLLARHPAVIAFVIVAGEVEQAMQDESLDLHGRAVSERSAVLPRDVGGYGDIARILSVPATAAAFAVADVRRETRARRSRSPCRGTRGSTV